MKYPFDTIKMLNKVTRLITPITDLNGYSCYVNTQNFICETVDDQVCHSITLTVHHSREMILKISVNNYSEPKKNKERLKQIKEFVNSVVGES